MKNLILLMSILNLNDIIFGMQSNHKCIPAGMGFHEGICYCENRKALQLFCEFNPSIQSSCEGRELHAALTKTKYNQVSISRDPDPHKAEIAKKFEMNTAFDDPNFNKSVCYYYFPNFGNSFIHNYNNLKFEKFEYVPTFAFYDKNKLDDYEPFRKYSSIRFLLTNLYDFGVDRFAFYGVDADDLLLEGPHDHLTIHRDAFKGSFINELTIGCYCIDECESFIGSCNVYFVPNVRETYPQFESQMAKMKKRNSIFKKIKIFGAKIGNTSDGVWDLQYVPNIETLEYLEISNLPNTPDSLSPISKFVLGSAIKTSVTSLILERNGLTDIDELFLVIFTSLRSLGLAHNRINHVAEKAFVNNPLLENLNLQHNEIHTLYKGMFLTLINLRFFDLGNNILNGLEDYTFSQMKKLQYLDLTRNNISVLTAHTFDGLVSLRELILSYNPLKSIDIDTFHGIALNSPDFKRIDLISHINKDWFVFDENDICLLSHFKCGTKINIDMDQPCNCFMKYMNEISGLPQHVEIMAADGDEQFTYFHPCVVTPPEKLRNHEVRYYMDNIPYHEHDYDPALYITNAKDKDDTPMQKKNQKCHKKLLKQCYAKVDLSIHNQSCLYNKFISSNPILEIEKINPKVDHGKKNKILFKENNKVIADAIFPALKVKISNDSETISFSVNKRVAQYFGLGIIVVSFMAFSSFIIGLYLLTKRKSYNDYATANSEYNE